MSKHFSLFQTESLYQAAKYNLDFPHVSLIETTGDVKYIEFKHKELFDAPFGSIILAEVATEKLFYITNEEYNLTEYPFNDYKPIAVCIYDHSSNSNDQTVLMSVQWMDYQHLGQGNASIVYMDFGFYKYNLSADVPSVRSDTESSIKINDDIAQYITKDYSGSSVSRTYAVGDCDPYGCCKRFETIGTNEGDWLFPSYNDVLKYKDNISTIKNVFDNIKTLCGSSYLNTTDFGNGLGVFRETDTINRRILYSDGRIATNYWKNNGAGIKAVLVITDKEL